MNIQPFMPAMTNMNNSLAAQATGKTGTGSSAGSSNITGDPTGTFLQLLITELKAQDPTSPLDPNQMTQQIVSLNQLDQLIQIRQILQGVTTGSTGSNSSTK